MRRAEVTRKTRETQVRAAVNLDGEGRAKVATGIGFLDHMLEQLARHSLIDLEVEAKGDLHIDFHHTTEDTGIVIGQAVAEALGSRAGIQRYGDALIPMDETLTRVALDASNRPYLIWKVSFTKPKLGEMDTELFRSGSTPSPRPQGSRSTSRTFTARTTTTSSRAATRAWRGPCGRPSASIRASPTPCPPPRASSAAP